MWLNYGENYSVSDGGLVMNRKTGLILSPGLDRKGYPIVCIYDKTTRVHRIVADRFCPKTRDDLEVDHINRDEKDNNASNLRWCDRSTNQRNKNSKNICKHRNGYIVQFKRYGKHIYQKTFKTMEEAVAARDAFKLTDAYKL